MNPLRLVAGVRRSAGRGIVSATEKALYGLIHFPIFLVLPNLSYSQDTQQRVIVICYVRGENVGSAICDERYLKPCIDFSNGCVDRGGTPKWYQFDGKVIPPGLGNTLNLHFEKQILPEAQGAAALSGFFGDPARLVVFPSPSSGQIRVVLTGASRYRVHVYHWDEGKPFFSQAVENEEGVVVSLPKKGRYIVIVEEGNAIWNQLVVNE
ncbi:MAG: hypothetical protein N2170_06570 [Bacteroidia bacterium]|nr:hypothetical protein [Bacteroidia bacterium]